MAHHLLKLTGSALKQLSKSQPIARRWASTEIATLEQTLQLVPETQVTTIKNGLRVATEQTGLPTCTVGVWIDAGSRYEDDATSGVAHFVEHMAFKGTAKRAKAALEAEVEGMGAHLNAYTTREQSAFFMKCFSKDLPKAVEILGDIIQNPKFEDAEIENERNAILSEMEELETNTKEVALDYLHAVAYQGTPLGRTIYGTTENIKSLTKQNMVDYVSNNFVGPRMVVAGAGGVDHKELEKLVNQHFGGIKTTYDGKIPQLTPCRFTGSEVRDRDDWMPFAHVAVAIEGCGLADPNYIPLLVANTSVGSWDRSHGGGLHSANILSAAAAEFNLGHSYEAFFTAYRDTSLWGVHYVCEKMQLQDFMHYIQETWMRLCTQIPEVQVEQAKNLLKTNLLLQLEGTTQTCDEIGRQVLNYGRRVPVSELVDRIEAVNAQTIRDVCTDYIYDRCPAIAAVGPTENLLDYLNIRSKMAWIRV